MPSAAAAGGFGFGAIAIAVFAAFAVGCLGAVVARSRCCRSSSPRGDPFKLRRGQRTAEGRAVCDQVEGFKTYLATAEADQLRFEEGEDIFSKYLPWAIIFELADRWAKICGDLVAMGRLPNATPYWYVGNYHMAAFNTSFLTSSLTTAATPAPLREQRHRVRRRQLVRRRRFSGGGGGAAAAAAGSVAASVDAAIADCPTQVDDEDQRLARLDHAAGPRSP